MELNTLQPEPCPLCGGRGWIVVTGGGAGTAKACICRTQSVRTRLLAAAGIPERYQHCRLTNFQLNSKPAVLDQLLGARASCQQYISRFEAGERHSGLIFVGPPGVGKTHLAVAVLAEIVEKCAVPARFVELTSFVNQLQATFDPTHPETTQDVLAPLMTAPLIVLDELGAQQPTPWLRDILYLIINTRYTKRLATIFTTNYRLQTDQIRIPPKNYNLDRGRDPEPVKQVDNTPALLSTRLPAMLVSRLNEMAQAVLLLDVDDYRRKQARELQMRFATSRMPQA